MYTELNQRHLSRIIVQESQLKIFFFNWWWSGTVVGNRVRGCSSCRVYYSYVTPAIHTLIAKHSEKHVVLCSSDVVQKVLKNPDIIHRRLYLFDWKWFKNWRVNRNYLSVIYWRNAVVVLDLCKWKYVDVTSRYGKVNIDIKPRSIKRQIEENAKYGINDGRKRKNREEQLI